MLRMLRNPARPVTQTERDRLARSLERLADEAARERRERRGPTPRGARSLYAPAVVSGSAPALRAIATTLRDASWPVSRVSLRQVEDFICDGFSSPLLGRDVVAARRRAIDLHHALRPAAVRSRVTVVV